MATPSPTPSGTATVVASSPQLVWVLLIVFAIALVGAFVLALYNIRGPRILLLKVLDSDLRLTEQQQSDLLRRAGLVSERVTRASLAFIGFALLGVLVIASLALTGAGAQDLRSTLAGSVTTLIATIAGFYFASRSESLTKSTTAVQDDGAADAATPQTDDSGGSGEVIEKPKSSRAGGSSPGAERTTTTLDAAS